MSNRLLFDVMRRGMLACLVVSTVACAAQDPVTRPEPGADSMAQTVRALSEQVRALETTLAEMRSDGERTRAGNPRAPARDRGAARRELGTAHGNH